MIIDELKQRENSKLVYAASPKTLVFYQNWSYFYNTFPFLDNSEETDLNI